MYEIKRAKKRHWSRIQELIAQNPGTLEQRFLPKPKEFFVALGERNRADNRRELLGCVALEGHHKERLAELRSLAVAEHHRGEGLGKALIEYCLREAKKKGVKQVLTITGSPKLFKGFGFDFFRTDEKYALINDLLRADDERES